jgi:hypothetical protein
MNDHDLIPAISVWQPWAWAICHLDKDVENRSWHTSYRGPVLIHAAKRWDQEDILDANDFIISATRIPEKVRPVVLARDLKAHTGGIVGVAILHDCVSRSDSPWFVGPFGFVLTSRTPLPFTPYRGAQGLFKVPGTIAGPLLQKAGWTI